MQGTTFALELADGVTLLYRWLPEMPVKAVIQIAHGWVEHAGGYALVATGSAGRGTRCTRTTIADTAHREDTGRHRLPRRAGRLEHVRPRSLAAARAHRGMLSGCADHDARSLIDADP